MSKLKVNVTRKDITNGQRGKSWSCPVALAATRVRPEGSAISSAGIFHLFFWPSEPAAMEAEKGWTPGTSSTSTHSARLPEVATDFICDYDMGKDVEPFSFEVELHTRTEIISAAGGPSNA
jgi:hypothetical protein